MDAQQWTTALASHALQVTLLIGMVGLATRMIARNRPHLAHMLWILVLLKCLMPPTWSSPTSLFSWLSAALPTIQSTFEFDHSRPLATDEQSPVGSEDIVVHYGELDRQPEASLNSEARLDVSTQQSSAERNAVLWQWSEKEALLWRLPLRAKVDLGEVVSDLY